MTESPTVVRASEIRPGDFLDAIEGRQLRGPRGGRYRFAGIRVESRVVRCGWRDEYDHRRGFEVVPSTGVAFVLPGNAAELVDARIRRSVETEVGPYLLDDDLLAILDAPETSRAARIAAEAELDRRTRA